MRDGDVVENDNRPLRGLGNATIVLLSMQMALFALRLGVMYVPIPWPLRHLLGRLDNYGLALTVLTVIVFLLWFRRARINAEGSTWPQRRARAWTFWGWLIPVGSLWIPFQLMADIWRASLPEDQRRKTAWLPGLWWICLLLASIHRVGSHSGFYFNVGVLAWWWSLVLVEAALALLIMIVARVSDSPIG